MCISDLLTFNDDREDFFFEREEHGFILEDQRVGVFIGELRGIEYSKEMMFAFYLLQFSNVIVGLGAF